MRNVLGNVLTLTLFGESHGEQIGACIDGITPGILLDEDFIKECMLKRRPSGKGETSRVELDEYKIISGVFNNYTTGAPLTIIIKNKNVNSKDYEKNHAIPRPSHADFTSHVKYNGFEDYRGGGHFSGRITAPIVAVCSILLKALKDIGIDVSSHIKQCGTIVDRDYNKIDEDINILNSKSFPVLDDIENDIIDEMNKASDENDSIGGIIQCCVSGLPSGIGEPWFSSLEGEISKAMFAIGGVKGIEFGLGFNFSDKKGSKVNDEFILKDNKVTTISNNNGGINGGISNGMPVIFNLAIKPTPSIYKEQNSVNLNDLTNTKLTILGRHDPSIVRRINIVATCLLSFVITDMLMIKYGNDVLKKGIK